MQIRTDPVLSRARRFYGSSSSHQLPRERRCCRRFFHSPQILMPTSGLSQDLLVSWVITVLRVFSMAWIFTRGSSTTLRLTSHFPRRFDERHDDAVNEGAPANRHPPLVSPDRRDCFVHRSGLPPSASGAGR